MVPILIYCNVLPSFFYWNHTKNRKKCLQVNLFQVHLFLHQLTHNMTKDCPWNYQFSTSKVQSQNMAAHVLRLEFSCAELVPGPPSHRPPAPWFQKALHTSDYMYVCTSNVRIHACNRTYAWSNLCTYVLHFYVRIGTYAFCVIRYHTIGYRHSPATAGDLSFWHLKIEVQELSWEAVPSNLCNPMVQKSTGTLGRFTLWICTFWTTYLQTGLIQP